MVTQSLHHLTSVGMMYGTNKYLISVANKDLFIYSIMDMSMAHKTWHVVESSRHDGKENQVVHQGV